MKNKRTEGDENHENIRHEKDKKSNKVFLHPSKLNGLCQPFNRLYFLFNKNVRVA